MARLRIGDLLVKAGLIDEMQLQSALAHQKRWAGKLGDVLVEQDFLDEEMLWRGLSKQLSMTLVTLDDHQSVPAVRALLPLALAEEHGVFPLQATDRELRLAVSDPGDLQAQDEIGFKTNRRISIVLSPAPHIKWAIDRFYRGQDVPCPAWRKRRYLPSEEGEPIRDEDWNGPATKGSSTIATTPAGQAPVPAVSSEPPPPSAPVSMSYGASHQTPIAALVQTQTSLAALQPQLAAASSPSMLELARIETELRQTTRFLRLVIDACINRGLFTREEYLDRVNRLANV